MGYVVVTKKQRGTPEMPTSILTSVPTLPPTRPSGWRSHVASHQHTPFHSSHGHVCVVQNITCPMRTECNTATGDCQDYRGRMLQPESVVLERGTRTRCRRRYWQYHWSERLGHELYFRCHVVWRAIYDTTHNGTSGNHELLSPPRNVDRHIHVGPLGAVVVLSTPWNCGTKTNQTAASLTVLASSSGVLYTPVGDFTPLASNSGQQRFPIGTRTFFFDGMFEARFIRVVMNDCDNRSFDQCLIAARLRKKSHGLKRPTPRSHQCPYEDSHQATHTSTDAKVQPIRARWSQGTCPAETLLQ